MDDSGVSKTELNQFKNEVRLQMEGVRADLKDLTKALRELIRLEGSLNGLAKIVERLGRENDDQEKRLRQIEIGAAGTSKSVGLFDGMVKHVFVLVIGATVGAVLMKVI